MTQAMLIEPREAQLDTLALREVARRLGPTPTRISPLGPESPLLTRPATDATVASAVTDTAASMLSVAHSATVVAQLELVLEEKVLTHLVCFSPNAARSVCLSPTQDGVVVREPAPIDWLVGGVASYFGSSGVRAVPFFAEIDLRAAWPLAIALDLQRRHTLMALAGAVELSAVRFDAGMLVEAAQRGPHGWQSLSTVLGAVTGSGPELTPATMQWGLDELARHGWVEVGPGGHGLTGDSLAFARRFLLVDSMLRAQIAREPRPEALEKGLLWFVQAGVHDVLSIEASEGSVALQTVSAAGVLDLLQSLLEDPTAASENQGGRGKHGTQVMPAFQ